MCMGKARACCACCAASGGRSPVVRYVLRSEGRGGGGEDEGS